MRTMVNPQTGQKLNIVKHMITKHGWEYYITDDKNNTDDVKFCLVMGFETEMGDVYIPEVLPHVISIYGPEEIAPAEGWEWETQ